MAIKSKFIIFDTISNFQSSNGINNKTTATNGYYGNVPEGAVVFIKDTGLIWFHGTYFGIDTSLTYATQSWVTSQGYTKNTGTVTSIATGAGLTGGTITTSGTIKANLVHETKASFATSETPSNRVTGRSYPVSLDSNGKLMVYVPWADNNTTSFTITANATDGLWDITGTNGTNAVTYAVGAYGSQQSKASFDTSSTAPTRSDRLNYNGYLYATKLFSGGAEVLTSHQSLSNYYTKTESDNKYVYKSGDTITGAITMNTGTGIAMKYTSSQALTDGAQGDPWIYPNGAPAYGIRYFEGNPDIMTFSASGNNTLKTSADFAINGDGVLYNKGNIIATQTWVSSLITNGNVLEVGGFKVNGWGFLYKYKKETTVTVLMPNYREPNSPLNFIDSIGLIISFNTSNAQWGSLFIESPTGYLIIKQLGITGGLDIDNHLSGANNIWLSGYGDNNNSSVVILINGQHGHFGLSATVYCSIKDFTLTSGMAVRVASPSYTYYIENTYSKLHAGNYAMFGDLMPRLANTTYNLGSSTYKWNNLYLSNSLSDGTNSLTVANIKSTYDWYQTMTTGDTDGTINKWKEIESFVNGISDTSTLNGILAGKANMYSYTIGGGKTVRITYDTYQLVIISVSGSNKGGLLVIIGSGYGEEGVVRNKFTEVVSCSTSMFTWSLPASSSISKSIEIHSNRTNDSTITVISTGSITFTEISALTTAALNAPLATQAWVASQGYLTSHQSLSSYFHYLGANLDLNQYDDGNNNNGIIYINTSTPSNINSLFNYGSVLNFSANADSWLIAHKHTGTLMMRTRWWSQNNNDWGDWTEIITSDNISSYAITSHQSLANYLPLSGGTLTGYLGYNLLYLPIVKGGVYTTNEDVRTGCLTINLPADISNTMTSMWVDVYNYSTGTSFSVHIGGYTYSSSTWQHNPAVMVYGALHRVRLGYNNGFKIYIGETDSTWHYPQVLVRDVICGYNCTFSKIINSWSISFETSLPTIPDNANRVEYAWTTRNFNPSNYALASSLDGYVKNTGDTMTGGLIFARGTDDGFIFNKYNNTNYPVLRSHNNGNISLSASGGELYIGFRNTSAIHFLTSNSTIMSITNKVGIGTTSPSYLLDVNGATRSTYVLSTLMSARHLDAGKNAVHADHNLYIGYGAQTYTNNTYLYYSTGTSGSDSITSRTCHATVCSYGFNVTSHLSVGSNLASFDTSYVRAELDVISTTDTPCDIWLGVNKTRYWYLSARGSSQTNNLWIGRSSGSGIVEISVPVSAPDYTATSDIRLKRDIQQISDHIYSFRFKDSDKLHYGFIALKLEKEHPDLVGLSDYKTVNYNSALSLYVAELENRVKILENEINNLKSK